MTATPRRLDERVTAMNKDKAIERRLLWKGILSVVVVVGLAYVRTRWWL